MHTRNMNKTKRAASPLVFRSGKKAKVNAATNAVNKELPVFDGRSYMLSHFLYARCIQPAI